MMHRLSDALVIDLQDGQNLEFYSQGDYVKGIFYKVFENLNDKNGVSLKGKIDFKPSYLDIIEKCNIENSMNIIYKLLNKHIASQDFTYFKDDDETSLPRDVMKILEFMNHLHKVKVPKRFVAGFLMLMVKFTCFTAT